MSASLYMDLCFHFSWADIWEWAGYARCIFNFLKRLSNCFPKWSYQFTFLVAMYESSCSFISSPTLGMINLFSLNYFNRCVMVSHCGFNLHFPIDHYFSFLIIFHFFGKVFKSFAGYFFIGLFVFLSLSFESSLYILDIRPLSYVICKHFSQSMTCLFILLTVSKGSF